MTDKTFIRFGIAFIFLLPVVMAPQWADKTAKRWPDGTKIDGYSQRMKDEANWHCKDPRRARRDIMLTDVLTPEGLQLGQYPESFLRWLVVDLEGRPLERLYDVNCIRLLGIVKNYLDSAGSCGIVEMLPEQTTQRENNAEPKRSRDAGERTMGQSD